MSRFAEPLVWVTDGMRSSFQRFVAFVMGCAFIKKKKFSCFFSVLGGYARDMSCLTTLTGSLGALKKKKKKQVKMPAADSRGGWQQFLSLGYSLFLGGKGGGGEGIHKLLTF